MGKRKLKFPVLSKSKFSAILRRLSEQISSSYDYCLPTGEFVSEKYITDSIGLKLTDFKPYRKKFYKVHHEGHPTYKDAEKFYFYSCKVLWLYHPDLGSSVHQYSDMHFHALKKANVKKVLEKLK